MPALFRVIFIVPLAYICSCAAAGLTIYAAWQHTGLVLQEAQFELILGSVFVAMAFGAVSFPVSLIGIIIAETFTIRSFVWFVILGLLNGYILSWTLPEFPAVFSYQGIFENTALSGFEASTTAYLAGGSAFGLVYWLLVGRHSGFENSRTS